MNPKLVLGRVIYGGLALLPLPASGGELVSRDFSRKPYAGSQDRRYRERGAQPP